jgi:nucleotide-binding universal stress UspA family protein
MKTIIAATDFSPVALNAVYYAADLCLVTGSDLVLFHAFPIPVADHEWQQTPALLPDADEQLNRLRDKILFRMAERIRVTARLEVGEVVLQLQEYCEAVNPYAVVMGAESTNTFERFLFGAKTITAMQKLTWPLIVVPPDVTFKEIKKIALACDLKNVESIPLQEIKTLVKQFNASLHVLHVSTYDGEMFTTGRVEELDLLRDLLRELKPEYHHFHNQQIEDVIVGFSEANSIDMLVVIPKEHNVISKLFRHSVSSGLVLHAHFPVMAIHE